MSATEGALSAAVFLLQMTAARERDLARAHDDLRAVLDAVERGDLPPPHLLTFARQGLAELGDLLDFITETQELVG